MAEACAACGAVAAVVTDAFSGLLCCNECGTVYDDDELGAEHQAGLVGERGGFGVVDDGAGARAIGVAGGRRYWSKSRNSAEDWQAKKKADALKRLGDLVSMLQLQRDAAKNVEAMVEKATGGEWGMGRWLGVLMGACIYIVVRKSHLPLTLVEVAYAVDCDVPELGRMFNRLLKLLEITLPKEDPIIFLERLVSRNTLFLSSGREVVKKVINQCRVLLEWVQQWYVTTGRHLLPVAAAVLFVIAEANDVAIGLEEICLELPAHIGTATKRYKEIQEAFVTTLHDLPWCKDVTKKNIKCHLSFLLRYLEATMNLAKRKKSMMEEDVPNEAKKLKALEPCGAEFENAVGPSSIMPKAFIVSETARTRRLVKMELVAQRIAKAKQALSGKCAASGDTRQEKLLDGEDIVIEQLMLGGVKRNQIEQGHYEALMATIEKMSDEHVSDEEIMQYLYGKDELVALIQRVKLQNLVSPWVDG